MGTGAAAAGSADARAMATTANATSVIRISIGDRSIGARNEDSDARAAFWLFERRAVQGATAG